MVLDREAILAAQDLMYEELEVPEWGGKVRLRGLTGEERDQYEAAVFQFHEDSKGRQRSRIVRENVRALLVSLCLVDAEGNRLFGDGDAAAVKLLGRKSAKALDRIYEVASRLSGIGEREEQELEAGLPGAPGADSPSS